MEESSGDEVEESRFEDEYIKEKKRKQCKRPQKSENEESSIDDEEESSEDEKPKTKKEKKGNYLTQKQFKVSKYIRKNFPHQEQT